MKDEIICDLCNGSGRIDYEYYKNDLLYITKILCKKCIGFGKLNWIENIFGKNINPLSSWLDEVNMNPENYNFPPKPDVVIIDYIDLIKY